MTTADINIEARKYNAYKIIHDSGNGSWVGTFDVLNDLIDHCNSENYIRKTCDLHFYTWKGNPIHKKELQYMGAVCFHNPKDNHIPNEGTVEPEDPRVVYTF